MGNVLYTLYFVSKPRDGRLEGGYTDSQYPIYSESNSGEAAAAARVRAYP